MADPLTIASLIATIGGGLGSIFGGDDAEDLLKQQLKGIDPKILEEMRRRTRSAVGNQATAERVSTQQSLERQDAPVAKQQEVSDQIRTRQFGAIGDALAQIDFMNEQHKRSATQNLANYYSSQNQGQGYADLFGAGFGGLMQANQLEELGKLFKNSGQFQPRTFGNFGGGQYTGLNYRPNF